MEPSKAFTKLKQFSKGVVISTGKMQRLCEMTHEELLNYKEYLHRTYGEYRREFYETKSTQRIKHIHLLLHRLDVRLQSVYYEFERRATQKYALSEQSKQSLNVSTISSISHHSDLENPNISLSHM